MISEQIAKQTKWDNRWLGLAEFVASFSKDPSNKVGAVIVRPDQTLASIGFNGFPRVMPDNADWLHDRAKKYPRTIHAELNAREVCPERPIGYTLYVWPVLPCDRCATHVAQSGITRVVAPICPPHWLERWGPALEEAHQIFRDCGIQLDEMPFDGLLASLTRDPMP